MLTIDTIAHDSRCASDLLLTHGEEFSSYSVMMTKSNDTISTRHVFI